ncbi:hypothetical protein, partial [Hymenobacter cheonanensis]|uniref:hypothetical protein n=1 Tax=Hymenobacter sp. CA2-7 TaxID=3063993 RepID=UPI002713664D
MPTSKKLSQQPVVVELLPGDRLPALRRAVDEADASKRNPTVGAEAVATWLTPFLATADFTHLDLPGARALLTSTAPDPQVRPGAFYTIDGDWNATGNDARVFVQGLALSAFSPVGVLRDALGAYSFVQVDVMAATAVPVASPPSGGRNTGPYKPGSDYTQYDLVTYRGLSYYAGEDASGVGAFDPTDWRVFGPDPAVVAANT